MIVIVLALTLGIRPGAAVHAVIGDLDPAFGNGGKVLTDLFGTSDAAGDCALQSDGKIVLVGFSFVGGRTNMALVRYNVDGSLDDTFGEGGKVTTDFFDWYDDAAAVAIQPDNKIVVGGGAARQNQESDFALARYTADGSLDSSFGIGGIVTTEFLGLQDRINDIAIQPDGKILAAGTSFVDSFFTSRITLARYNADGSLDVGFGSDGKVISFSLGLGGEGGNALALRQDGRILVAGYVFSDVFTGYNFALRCFNSDGSVSVNFGFGGSVTTDFMNEADVASTIAIQSDGRIVVGGFATAEPPTLNFGLARYNENGSSDLTYGVGGKVLTVSDTNEVVASIALQHDGKLIAAGSTFNSVSRIDFCITRYGIDGALDTTFGNQGRIITDFAGDTDAPTSVLIQPDGKIIASGSARVDEVGDFALARYEGEPPFNICMQDESNGNALQLNTMSGVYVFSNCRKGWSVSGTGIVRDRGCKIEFQDIRADRNIVALINVCTNTANASVRVTRRIGIHTVVDRNIANNTCGCE